ncbi:hypothetical protein BpHYR1_000927 [Brachionus plicatilis]|uniref:Uncharacterized protein n=1 Tax=Brachionus plicatilis TaxID=10195 RepID=A0A3M7P2N3_BRAPC|nr:hypothetical protein BpHYR1_000927 [Brachionus plicatilis]
MPPAMKISLILVQKFAAQVQFVFPNLTSKDTIDDGTKFHNVWISGFEARTCSLNFCPVSSNCLFLIRSKHSDMAYLYALSFFSRSKRFLSACSSVVLTFKRPCILCQIYLD